MDSPSTLVGSDASAKSLLFGEIDTSSKHSLRTNTSFCNLTLSSNSTFLKFWLLDNVRDTFLSSVDKKELANLRLVCHDFSNRAAPKLFSSITTTFRPSTFTRPSRIAALEGIGHHVQTLTFKVPHTCESYLPPLIDPLTGEERTFVYTPQVYTSHAPLDKDAHPKYGSLEVADLLVKQYPPLFHAATNVPSFINALAALPKLTHLRISCPQQYSLRPARRSVVDYALISLRIAIERAPLDHLEALSFLPIHAAGLFYLEPLLGFGASPKATRRWAQIRKIAMEMEHLETEPAKRAEQLKMLHKFLQNFSNCLTHFLFRWRAGKGPCPVSLDSEPLYRSHRPFEFANDDQTLRPLRFSRLQRLEVENAIMDAEQVQSFISRHRRTLVDFNFDKVKLRTGTWDEALSPLSKISGNDTWKDKQTEVMDVPIMLSPAKIKRVTIVELHPSQADEHHQCADKTRASWYRWLNRARSQRSAVKAKEQLLVNSDHARRTWKGSVIPWR